MEVYWLVIVVQAMISAGDVVDIACRPTSAISLCARNVSKPYATPGSQITSILLRARLRPARHRALALASTHRPRLL
jgi:hypothetical protein